MTREKPIRRALCEANETQPVDSYGVQIQIFGKGTTLVMKERTPASGNVIFDRAEFDAACDRCWRMFRWEAK